MLSFKPTVSLSTFTFTKSIFSISSLSAIRVVSSAYLRLLIFLPAILIPACASSRLSKPQQVILPVSSVAQSCLTLCNTMDCSKPGFPVHQQFLELTQTQVHRIGDAIQPSHPLSSSSPPALNLSQHQGLFK